MAVIDRALVRKNNWKDNCRCISAERQEVNSVYKTAGNVLDSGFSRCPHRMWRWLSAVDRAPEICGRGRGIYR